MESSARSRSRSRSPQQQQQQPEKEQELEQERQLRWLDTLLADATASNQERGGKEPEAPAADAEDARQLRADLEVLAAHAEAQARELRGARVESEALRKDNARRSAQAAAAARELQVAAEARAQLERALAQQARRGEELRAEREALATQVVDARSECETARLTARRLEQELTGARAAVQRLEDERCVLQSALQAAAARRADAEQRQLRAQDEVIRSLRADLLQMEFECRTLRADAEVAAERAARGARRGCARGAGEPAAAAPVSVLEPPLGARPPKPRATIRPLKARADGGRGSVLGGLMDLPNAVREPEPDVPRGIVARVASTVKRRLGASP